MSRPLQEKSIDAATGTTTGTAYESGTRISVMIFVVAKNLDTADDTVQVDLEVSQDDGSNWAKVRDEDGNQILRVTASEFEDPDGNGNFAAYAYAHGVAADKLRANLNSFTDAASGDLEVDAYVGAYGRGPAENFRTV